MKVRIVGIAGKAGHGKDTFASFLAKSFLEDVPPWVVDSTKDVRTLHFATPVKQIAMLVFGLTADQVNTEEGKRSRPPQCYGFTVRELLMKIGTEMFRDGVSPTIWCDTLERKLKDNIDSTKAVSNDDHEMLFLIPDVRFKDEVLSIKRMGGTVIGVRRAHADENADPTHRSESAIDTIFRNDCAVVVENDSGLEDLKRKAEDVYKNHVSPASTKY